MAETRIRVPYDPGMMADRMEADLRARAKLRRLDAWLAAALVGLLVPLAGLFVWIALHG